MIPNQLLRKEIEKVQSMVEARGMSVDFAEYAAQEEKRRTLQADTESLQMQSNQLSKEVAMQKRAGEDAGEILKKLGELAKQKKTSEQALKALLEQMREFELMIPNMLDEKVPLGKDESDNVHISTHGKVPTFEHEVLSHTQLSGDQLDFVRAAKVSGSRYVFMKSVVARLHRALAQWMLDTQVEKGYVEINPPLVVESEALYGTGQMPKFADDQFFTEGGSALIPTAEVSVTNLLRDEIVAGDTLPQCYVALTPCFRKEAGAYGKDTHGLIRLHQFEKVELVKFVTPQGAQAAFDALVEDAEHILSQLELPYRKVLLCSGDTGFSAHITYDLEVWMPSEDCYREISSCSYFGDFQARRMGARYRDEEGRVSLLHTINGSGLAVGRTLAAFLENHQTADGHIRVPKVLQPYLGGQTELILEG